MYTLAAIFVHVCVAVSVPVGVSHACKPGWNGCVFTNVRMSLRQTIECEQNFHQVTTKNFSTVLFLFVRSR